MINRRNSSEVGEHRSSLTGLPSSFIFYPHTLSPRANRTKQTKPYPPALPTAEFERWCALSLSFQSSRSSRSRSPYLIPIQCANNPPVKVKALATTVSHQMQLSSSRIARCAGQSLSPRCSNGIGIASQRNVRVFSVQLATDSSKVM
jgi:hypothetical protein